MRHTFLVVTVKKWLKSVYIYGSYCKIKQESPAAARKPRDAAAIPVSFHCHVVAFLFPVPMFRPSPHRCVVCLVGYMLFEMHQK